MKTGMSRLGRRSPGRTLAVPAVQYRRLAACGGHPGAPARVRGAGPDIIELILDYRERIGRLLRKDDDAPGCGEDPGCPEASALGVVPMRRPPVCTHVAPELGMRVVRGSWPSPMPRWKHCSDLANSYPSRGGCRVSRPDTGPKFTRRCPADQRSAPSGRTRGADPDMGAPTPSAIGAPQLMWPALS